MVADNPPSRLLPTAPRRHAADRWPTAYIRRIGHQNLRRDAPAAGGLIYNRNRLLHPAAGRFLQRDPLDQNEPGGGYHDGMSLYQYVNSNPMDRWDSSGLALEGSNARGCCEGDVPEIDKSQFMHFAWIGNDHLGPNAEWEFESGRVSIAETAWVERTRRLAQDRRLATFHWTMHWRCDDQGLRLSAPQRFVVTPHDRNVTVTTHGSTVLRANQWAFTVQHRGGVEYTRLTPGQGILVTAGFAGTSAIGGAAVTAKTVVGVPFGIVGGAVAGGTAGAGLADWTKDMDVTFERNWAVRCYCMDGDYFILAGPQHVNPVLNHEDVLEWDWPAPGRLVVQ